MSLLRVGKKIIVMLLCLGYRCLSAMIPVHKKTCLFISFHGKGYSDNPKAIYEKMRTMPQFSEFNMIWAIRNHKKKNIQIEGAKVVEYLSFSYFYYLARSAFWIFNCKMPVYVFKKKEQIYLQTWHGTPLMRLAHDIQISGDAKFYRSG